MFSNKRRTVLCWVAQSCPTLWDRRDCSPPGSSVLGDSPGKNTGVSCHALLQGNLRSPGIEPGSPALQVDSLPAELPGKPSGGAEHEMAERQVWEVGDLDSWGQWVTTKDRGGVSVRVPLQPGSHLRNNYWSPTVGRIGNQKPQGCSQRHTHTYKHKSQYGSGLNV